MLYIAIKNSKYLIRIDKEAFLLFYKYFLDKPVIFGYSRSGKALTRYFYKFVEVLIRFFYVNFFATMLFKTKEIEDDFLVQRRGKGNWSNLVYLIRKGKSNLKIKKCYSSEKKANDDLTFISTYKGKSEYILFPNFNIVDKKTVEFDFFQEENLWIYLRHYYLDLEEIENIFTNITSALDAMYGYKNLSLIHGDLFPINIYKKDKYYYLIDFSDSHYYETGFDKYYLFTSMLKASYGHIEWEVVKKYFSLDKIKQYQKHLSDYKNGKYYA